MDFSKLLPVGSVVLLENAQKKVVIMGIMPVKHKKSGQDISYDYIGVPYPEGFIGNEAGLLFDHDSIIKVCFNGYSNEERELFINTLQTIANSADNVLKSNK